MLCESPLIVARVEREGLPDLGLDDRGNVAGARRGAGADPGENDRRRGLPAGHRGRASASRGNLSKLHVRRPRATGRPAAPRRPPGLWPGRCSPWRRPALRGTRSTSRAPHLPAGLIDQDHPGRLHGRTLPRAGTTDSRVGSRATPGRPPRGRTSCCAVEPPSMKTPIPSSCCARSQWANSLQRVLRRSGFAAAHAVGAAQREQARRSIGVDDEFVQLIDMRVGTQPLVDARAVGVPAGRGRRGVHRRGRRAASGVRIRARVPP